MAKKRDINAVFTRKQKKFFEHVAMGFTLTEAAKMAGYKQPRNSAASNVQNYTQAFRHAFISAGYTILDITKDIIEGTKAMRTISAVDTGKEANGASCDFIDVPDWNARHKFIDSAIKLQGFYPNEKHELLGKNGESLMVTIGLPPIKPEKKNNE